MNHTQNQLVERDAITNQCRNIDKYQPQIKPTTQKENQNKLEETHNSKRKKEQIKRNPQLT